MSIVAHRAVRYGGQKGDDEGVVGYECVETF